MRCRRVFPDVYAPAHLDDDLALRARAAGVLVSGRGVVAGYAAAELWGASCGPPDDPVDVLVPYDYRCAGLRVHRGRVHPDETGWVGVLQYRHLGVRRGREISAVLALVDPRAESPMESRTRMALHLGGLPAPTVQHPVVARGSCYYLDLAYPAVRLGIEYDGAEHRTQCRARRDLVREAALTALGWHILRFDADVVLFRPDHIVAAVRAELAARAVG